MPSSVSFFFWFNLALSFLAILGLILFCISHIRHLGIIGRQLAGLRESLSARAGDDSAGASAGIDHESLRLQACERFTLMLERISVPNLLLRIPPDPDTASREYTAELLLAIRQEVEYNITQQIYVSDSLWSIITQTRDNISLQIARAAEQAETSQQIAERLRVYSGQQVESPVALAQGAIRREASSVLTR